MPESAWRAAFDARADLTPYGSNALGLFALLLRFNIEYIVSVAVDTITDGSDDKKCDLVYIDQDKRVAIVAQCFLTSKTNASAPANKASDLNTAATWLLQSSIGTLPERLKPNAEAIRNGIDSGSIERLQFWYIHNQPESKNVKNELSAV